MALRPSAFDRLVSELATLPGIGKRSAERIAFHLIRLPADKSLAIAEAIRQFTQSLQICSTCGNVTESDPCPICSNPKRDQGVIMVVEQPNDVTSLEQTGRFNGVYHVLMGRVAPLENIGPGDLNIASLIDRIRQGNVREVILATNPTLEGDGTAMLLAERLAEFNVNITRIARGLPTGTHLNVLSKAVLADALQSRQAMST